MIQENVHEIGVLGAGKIGGTFRRLVGQKRLRGHVRVRDVNSPKVKELLDSIATPVRVGSVTEAAKFWRGIVLLSIHCLGLKKWSKTSQQLKWQNPHRCYKPHAAWPVKPAAAEDIASWAKGAKWLKPSIRWGRQPHPASNLAKIRADAFILRRRPCGQSGCGRIGSGCRFLDVVDAGPFANVVL